MSARTFSGGRGRFWKARTLLLACGVCISVLASSFLYSSFAGEAFSLLFSVWLAPHVSSKWETSWSMAERHGIKRSPVDGQLRRLPLDAEPGGRSVEAGVSEMASWSRRASGSRPRTRCFACTADGEN